MAQYYIGEETIFEVVKERYKEDLLTNGQIGLLVLGSDMGEDEKGNELGHPVKEFIPFKYGVNLDLVENALKILERALEINEEDK